MAYVYFDGDFVDESVARIPLMTHALHYGTGVFEGIRSYGDGERAWIFRPGEHFARFRRNAALLDMCLEPTDAVLVSLTIELLRCNGAFGDTYIRPLLFKSSAQIGAGLPPGETLAIIAVPMERGPVPPKPVSATWSRWRRFPAASCPAGAKMTGLYINSSLARADALARGYDQPILLTTGGDVAEGFGANIFAVFGRKIVTPPPEADILPGITRQTLLDHWAQLGHAVRSETLAPEQLLKADEVFFCGTGMEIVPVGRIEDRVIGDGQPGPITRAVSQWYRELVTGQIAAPDGWRISVAPGERSAIP
ncbi:MAG: aminotransferase class IV [Candidatus Zixiibacteriota bacterium]